MCEFTDVEEQLELIKRLESIALLRVCVHDCVYMSYMWSVSYYLAAVE